MIYITTLNTSDYLHPMKSPNNSPAVALVRSPNTPRAQSPWRLGRKPLGRPFQVAMCNSERGHMAVTWPAEDCETLGLFGVYGNPQKMEKYTEELSCAVDSDDSWWITVPVIDKPKRRMSPPPKKTPFWRLLSLWCADLGCTAIKKNRTVQWHLQYIVVIHAEILFYFIWKVCMNSCRIIGTIKREIMDI